MKGHLQLNLASIHLKRNYDSINLLDEVLPSIFKNEVYWCSMVYETTEMSSKSSKKEANPLNHVLNSKYALRLPGRESVKRYPLYPSGEIVRGDRSNIIEYNAPGKEIWRGELTHDRILRFNIWIMEGDTKPRKIDNLVNKFGNEINYINLNKVYTLLENRLPSKAIIPSMMSFISRIGAMILREDGDDLVAAYSGSLIGYNFKDPFYHNLKNDGANIALHLDKYENIEKIIDKNSDRPGCVISDFSHPSSTHTHFDKLYLRLEHSIAD